MSEPIVVARALTKAFQAGRHQVWALRGVDLDVQAGEFL